MMRKCGHREIAVALASAGIFAALHFTNLFTSTQGLPVRLVADRVHVAFGICMYLILRVTRTLIAPMLVHASTDPAIFLHGTYPTSSPLGLLPSLSAYLVIAAGFILLIVLIVSERRRTQRESLQTSLAVSSPERRTIRAGRMKLEGGISRPSAGGRSFVVIAGAEESGPLVVSVAGEPVERGQQEEDD